MLKRVCADRLRDWDRYINTVLLAYGEVSQESVSFLPFELVFRRCIRGQMSKLKELWTEEIADPQVRKTYSEREIGIDICASTIKPGESIKEDRQSTLIGLQGENSNGV